MNTKFAVALIGASLVALPANAATLVTYDLSGTAGSQTTQAAASSATGVNGLSLARGAGLGANSGASSFNSNGFTGETTDYVTFGLTVASGYTATIDQLLIGTRSSNAGPGLLNLLASVDGGAFNTVGSFTETGTDLYSNLSFSTLTALSRLEFRIVAANQTAAGGGTTGASGTFRVENYVASGTTSPVSINGTVAQVTTALPEPASWGMMILGFALTGAALRRRRTVRVSFAG